MSGRGGAPRLSVVIPTRGESAALPTTLGRLARQEGPGPIEVLLATDPDADPALVAQIPGVRVVRGEGAGASSKRNAGWRAASADLILFMGDDILAAPDLAARHLAAHDLHPAAEIGVLGHVRWADSLQLTPFMRWLDRGIQFDFGTIDGSEAGWGRFYTANVSVKRQLLERVGGFDEERLPFGYEDLDLAYRMSAHGFRLLYEPAARAEHLHPATPADWQRRVRLIARAERAFVDLHPEIEPYFHRLFSDAVSRPQARGGGRLLVGRFAGRLPWLGRRAWQSTDLYFRQQLAPAFLEAWEHAPGQ